MMTQIEMDATRSQIRVNYELVKKLTDIDWEQRRYEIAKEMLPSLYKEWTDLLHSGQNIENPNKLLVKGAVAWADDLIEELKKKNP